MAFVTEGNRPKPHLQPPPTAYLDASGATTEVPYLPMHPSFVVAVGPAGAQARLTPPSDADAPHPIHTPPVRQRTHVLLHDVKRLWRRGAFGAVPRRARHPSNSRTLRTLPPPCTAGRHPNSCQESKPICGIDAMDRLKAIPCGRRIAAIQSGGCWAVAGIGVKAGTRKSAAQRVRMTMRAVAVGEE